MEPSVELADDLYRDKVRAAKLMTPEQRLRAGAELFDYACSIAMAGIRSRHPNASEAEVLEKLRERLAIAERLETGR